MSKNWQQDIVDFHRKANQLPEWFLPQMPDDNTIKLRIDLINEEINETIDSMIKHEIIEVADGIIDSIVVLIGTAISYGIELQPIWDIIHKSNMNKFKGNYKIRQDGKLLKPDNWQSPKRDIHRELIKQTNNKKKKWSNKQ